ncbi:MAG: sulfurtransferase TusA family protein [Gammaproteobacteria bacterium]|nr:sulfurtransferase TusA family protein [Gammaproteobacteria bacterium]
MPITANVTLNLTGMKCPHTLLGAKRVLDDLKPGEILLLISDCPGTRDDLFSWMKLTDNEILKIGKDTARANGYYIRKGKRAPIKVNVSLDVRGLHCPGPVVEAKLILDGMRPGEIMKLVSNCSASKDEVDAWCRATGYSLLQITPIQPKGWAFFIRKTESGSR